MDSEILVVTDVDSSNSAEVQEKLVALVRKYHVIVEQLDDLDDAGYVQIRLSGETDSVLAAINDIFPDKGEE